MLLDEVFIKPGIIKVHGSHEMRAQPTGKSLTVC